MSGGLLRSAMRARVIFALLVHRAHMPRQSARQPEHNIALRACVVSALLVHHAMCAWTPRTCVLRELTFPVL